MPIVICDIDGTIADLKHRLHFIKDKPVDWDRFYSTADEDTVIQSTVMLVKGLMQKGCQVVFMTARPEKYRAITEQWLHKNIDIPYLALLMRKNDDMRSDTIVKKELYAQHLEDKIVRYAIDDRPRIIRMWEELGIETFDVGGGEEF